MGRRKARKISLSSRMRKARKAKAEKKKKEGIYAIEVNKQIINKMDAEVKNEEVTDNGYIPILIEPKQEVIDESWKLIEPKVEWVDEMNVKIEDEIDDSEYQHIIPYEYRDYLEQHTDTPVLEKLSPEATYFSLNDHDYVKQHTEKEQPMNSRMIPAVDESQVQCQKCGKCFAHEYPVSLKYHAVTHTNISRYACSVEGCGYKSWERKYVFRHMKNKHGELRKEDIVYQPLTAEMEEELGKIVKECFPRGTRKTTLSCSEKIKYKCQVCNSTISEATKIGKSRLQIHASLHTDIMFYKCIEPNCYFETKHHASMSCHKMGQHGISGQVSLNKVELTMEQKAQVKRTLFQCFPECIDAEGRVKLARREDGANPKTQERCEYYCRLCDQQVIEIDSGFGRRNHASEHTDIEFICTASRCQFKTKEWNVLVDHHRHGHGLAYRMMTAMTLGLTKEQALELKEMEEICFPQEKDDKLPYEP